MKGNRPCVYSETSGSSQNGESILSPGNVHTPLQVLVDACHQERHLDHRPPTSRALSPGEATPGSSTYPQSEPPHGFVPSPGTEVSVASTRVAPLSWFELLARDAASADNGFLLSPPQRFPQTPEAGENTNPQHSENLRPRSWRERESFQAAAFPRVSGIEARHISATVEAETPLPDDPSSWTTASPILLSELELRIFNHFVGHSSQWLDFYDPLKQISTTVPHLALRNPGLMKALLAFTARHMSLGSDQEPSLQSGTTVHPLTINRNVAVEYYYETLHYLNKAMQYPSYARSHQLVATALLISAYEMVDGSNQDWERHLKGVFWIQRFQDNDGESGGLRQAVWWAWVRQDVWVAMRERRRIFSFWQPKKPLSALTSPEMAMRATWLLGRCVNYASREEKDTTDLSLRLERGSELLYMLQQWHESLPHEFNALPVVSDTGIFPPIWVHPPTHAAALQAHSLARILVILHRPPSGSMQDYQAAQKLLSFSVNTICGIARAIDPADTASSLSTLPYIFGGNVPQPLPI